MKTYSPIKPSWIGVLIEVHETDFDGPRGYRGRHKMKWTQYKIDRFDETLITKCTNGRRNPMVRLACMTSTATLTYHPDLVNRIVLGERIKGIRLVDR